MYIYYIILHYIYIYIFIYTLTKKLQEKRCVWGGRRKHNRKNNPPPNKKRNKNVTYGRGESGGSQGNQEITTSHVWCHQEQRGQQRHPTLTRAGPWEPCSFIPPGCRARGGSDWLKLLLCHQSPGGFNQWDRSFTGCGKGCGAAGQQRRAGTGLLVPGGSGLQSQERETR